MEYINNLERDYYYNGCKLLLGKPDPIDSEIMHNFIYNSNRIAEWGINEQNKHFQRYKDGITRHMILTQYDISKLVTSEKYNPKLKFLRSVPTFTARRILYDIMVAFEKGINCRGFKIPNIKHHIQKTSFPTRYERCGILDGRLKIEGLPLGHTIPVNTHIFDNYGYNGSHCMDVPWENTYISYNNGNFYLSFSYKAKKVFLPGENTEVIGIDMGIRNTLTLSTGEVFHQPDVSYLTNRINRLRMEIAGDAKRRRRESSKLNTKMIFIPKSNNEIKREKELLKWCHKRHNILFNFYYTVIKNIVKRKPKAIVIEFFYVRDMYNKTGYMKENVDTTYFYSMRRIFEHNCERYGIPLIEANVDYPSTKICSACGFINHEIGSREVFKCPCCGLVIDRDLNASYNLRNLSFMHDYYGINDETGDLEYDKFYIPRPKNFGDTY